MKTRFLLLGIGLMGASCTRKQDEQPAPKPVAAFELPATIGINTAFSVQNTSTNSTAYAWVWGDGTTSTDAAPSHTFSQTGRFRVHLQATGAGGTDTLSKVMLVTPARPVAAFDVSATTDTYTPVPVQNRSTNATTYLWNWGDGTTATGANPSHNYPRLGTYRIRLQATGAGGIDTLSKVIQVNRLDALNVGRLAGSYYGRWIYYRAGASVPGGGPVITTGYATQQITVIDNTTVQVDAYPITYEASYPWQGHAPQRSNTSFKTKTYVVIGSAMTTQLLQMEQTGDSIYFVRTSSQNALYSEYKFYGKK